MTKKKQDEWQFFRKPSGHIAYNKKCLHWSAVPTPKIGVARCKSFAYHPMVKCIGNPSSVASASRATVWLFSAVTCSISADDRTGHPRKRGKQSVWTPTALGGASPKHSLSGAKPPSPHFRSTKIYQKRGKRL